MSKGRKWGDYKVVCDRTGAVVMASQCRRTWDNKFVLKSEWEPRHPQDTAQVARDTARPPIARPEPDLQFIDSTDVTADDL